MANSSPQTRNLLALGIALAVGASHWAHANVHLVTNLSDSGAGSLRAAINDANGDSHLPVVVDIAAVNGIITLTTGEIAITNGMTIQGPGKDNLVISGHRASRIFNIAPSSIADVIVAGIHLTEGSYPGYGGALVSRCTNLTLQYSTIDGSVATLGFGYGGGVAAIDSGCGTTLTLSHVTIANNSAFQGGGVLVKEAAMVRIDHSVISGNRALYSYGGGVAAYKTAMNIVDSQITGNRANGNGGGIRTDTTSTAIIDSQVTGNSGASGGGIYSISASSIFVYGSNVSNNAATYGPGGGFEQSLDANAQFAYSTLAGNVSSGDGGGLHVQSLNSSTMTTTVLRNVTVAGNVSSGAGGGIANASSLVTVTLDSSTIANNQASTGGGIFSEVGATTALHNTAIADNSVAGSFQDLRGAFTGSFVLIGSKNGDFTVTGFNILEGVDPLFGSLGNYGGHTPTMLPKPGSPLIDFGDAENGSAENNDQRGFARVAGGRIDIGAVERQSSEDVIYLDSLEGY